MSASDDYHNSLFRRAGRGDADAQLEVSKLALLDDSMSLGQRLAVAEAFARMCASQSRASGFRQLAAVLLLESGMAIDEGEMGLAAGRAGQAVAIYDMLADAGQEDASPTLEAMLAAADREGISEPVLMAAKSLRNRDLACV